MVDKEVVIKDYRREESTNVLNVPLVLKIAEKHNTSPNVIRMVLQEANLYEVSEPKPTVSRTNKAKEQEDLLVRVQELGFETTEDFKGIVSRMTGKACAFFNGLLSNVERKTD